MTPTDDAVFVRESLGRAPAGPLPPADRAPAVRGHGRRLAGVGAALAATVASQAIASALRVHLTAMEAPFAPDTAVAIAVLGAGLLVALWYLATAVGSLATLALRRDLGVARWGAPLARRLVVGAGLGLLAVVPAHAQTPDDISWGASAPSAVVTSTPPLATALLRPAGPLLTAVVAPLLAAPEPAVPTGDDAPLQAATHVVVAGECLWTIAAADLGPADHPSIAGRVAEYVAANPGLARNPDLIHPGDGLIVPSYPEGDR